MKTNELVLSCVSAINTQAKPARISLVIPGSHEKAKKVKLAPGKAPAGNIVHWNGNSVVAIFDAVDVLAWLTANGAVKVG